MSWFEHEVLREASDEQRLARVCATTRSLHAHLLRSSRERQRTLPELDFAPRATEALGPRFAATDEESTLTAITPLEEPLPPGQLMQAVSDFFAGALRPGSPHALFNMVPEPSELATAAHWLATACNSNSLMTQFGGATLRIEQRLAATVGAWANWPEARGISCSGGKATLLYALRCALSRAAPGSLDTGLPDNLLVLASSKVHYCLEHVASLLGLGRSRCLRLPVDALGRLDTDALATQLTLTQQAGQRVAAIVCCAGTTIDFHCDDVGAVLAEVDRFVAAHPSAHRPYVHLDSVIGWLYLCAGQQSAARRQALLAEVPEAQVRLETVLARFSAVTRVDSLGVDFHKNGGCPYASSLFVVRDARFMAELGEPAPPDEEIARPDSMRAYRYTLENSRANQGMLAAWVTLLHEGTHGLTRHLGELHRARQGLEAALRRKPGITLLNPQSLGWEVVFSLPLHDPQRPDAPQALLATQFMQACWARVRAGYQLPLFSMVPHYRPLGSDTASAPTHAFLLYPMRPLPDAAWEEMVRLILAQTPAERWRHIVVQSDAAAPIR